MPFCVRTLCNLIFVSAVCLLLTACPGFFGSGGSGGGGGGEVITYTSFELLDPIPVSNNNFGTSVVILNNGNVVVAAPGDDSNGIDSGAVHLYNTQTQALIASIYGDVAGDQLGSGGITALANSNFVIASPVDDEGGIVDAGSVRLVSGSAGTQIGSTLAGDEVNDQLGYVSVNVGGITALGNSNFVIASALDDEDDGFGGFILDAGSVRLVNGSTGGQINIFAGDVDGDLLGYVSANVSGITALGNNNFVISSRLEDVAVLNAGSVRLVDGGTGVEINMIAGDVANDQLGYVSDFVSGITVLGNNNFVVASALDNVGGLVDAGSVQLVNGFTGVPIAPPLSGDERVDQLGYVSDFVSGITVLGNNNFVIVSVLDDDINASFSDHGSVRLVDGGTGLQIGTELVGDVRNDQLGYVSDNVSGITALGNNNFVIASKRDDEGGGVNVGSVRLVDGSTGAQINTIAGEVIGDQLGYVNDNVSGITVLANNNFVIASPFDDEDDGFGGVITSNAGSVRLVDGSSGAQINMIMGDVANDRLGYVNANVSGITALANNNFVVASALDDEDDGFGVFIVDAGSVRLVNGTTGTQIGNTLAGDVVNDQLGYVNANVSGITALANNNFVVASALDDEDDGFGVFIVDAGSVRLVDGTTGTQIGNTLAGDVVNDQLGYVNANVSGITALGNNNFVIASALDDEDDGLGVFIVDAGSVRLVDGGSGAEINMIAGDVTNDQLGYVNANVSGITSLANNNFVVVSPNDDEGVTVDAGTVRRVDGASGLELDIITGNAAGDVTAASITESTAGSFYILALPNFDHIGGVDSGFVSLIAE